MSNEDMNLTNEPCEGTLAPGHWTESLTFQPASPSEMETWFRFGATFNGCLVVNGINLGPAADLAALVRDARRFRRMAAQYSEVSIDDGSRPIRLEQWDPNWGDWVTLGDRPLAEIADALPEVEG